MGSACVSVKIVSFRLKLNIEVAKFTTDIFNQIILELATLVNKTAAEVRITSLKNGSVLVSGNVETKNTTDESSTLSTLSFGLGTGSKIAGQLVMESSFVGYTPVYTAQE